MRTMRPWICPVVVLVVVLGISLTVNATGPLIPLRQTGVPRFIVPRAPRLLRPPAVVPAPPQTKPVPIPTRWNAAVMPIPTQWDARIILLKAKP